MYEYEAVVTKVYDGDSITVDIDLGFGIWKKKESIRLNGIDTPELRGSSAMEKVKAMEARDFLSSLIMFKTIKMQSVGKDKYGRYLADIFYKNVCINSQMIRDGYAREYTGGAKEPWNFD